MEIHQIQVYYWDDGDHVVKEYFFPTKELADQAVLDLNDLRDEEKAGLLLELDSKGNPRHSEEDTCYLLDNIRRRIILMRNTWDRPTLGQYTNEEEEVGQRWNWIDCDRSHINWKDWQEKE